MNTKYSITKFTVYIAQEQGEPRITAEQVSDTFKGHPFRHVIAEEAVTHATADEVRKIAGIPYDMKFSDSMPDTRRAVEPYEQFRCGTCECIAGYRGRGKMARIRQAEKDGWAFISDSPGKPITATCSACKKPYPTYTAPCRDCAKQFDNLDSTGRCPGCAEEFIRENHLSLSFPPAAATYGAKIVRQEETAGHLLAQFEKLKERIDDEAQRGNRSMMDHETRMNDLTQRLAGIEVARKSSTVHARLDVIEKSIAAFRALHPGYNSLLP